MPRYYEDLWVGETFPFREYTITAAEIREFAQQFDPQPFHLKTEPDGDSVFDEVVASGWHAASLSMRLLVDAAFTNIAVLGGRGVDELRWDEPVHAGDRLTGEASVTARSRDERGRGHVDFSVEIRRQDGPTVLSYTTLTMVQCRDK